MEYSKSALLRCEVFSNCSMRIGCRPPKYLGAWAGDVMVPWVAHIVESMKGSGLHRRGWAERYLLFLPLETSKPSKHIFTIPAWRTCWRSGYVILSSSSRSKALNARQQSVSFWCKRWSIAAAINSVYSKRPSWRMRQGFAECTLPPSSLHKWILLAASPWHTVYIKKSKSLCHPP